MNNNQEDELAFEVGHRGKAILIPDSPPQSNRYDYE